MLKHLELTFNQSIVKQLHSEEREGLLQNLENMPGIPDNTFDYLIGLQNIASHELNLSLPEIHRILKYGGNQTYQSIIGFYIRMQ